MRRMPLRMLALLAAAVLVLAACGDDDDDDVGAGDDTTTTAEAAEDDTTTTAADDGEDDGEDDGAAAGSATVGVTSSDLGDILVDDEGFSLYLFANDAGGESTCYDQCAQVWPPLTVEGEPAAGDGADASLLGTTERTDGTTQVTYNGHPLYYYEPDQAPGDTMGQGVGDVWFVVAPDGEPIA